MLCSVLHEIDLLILHLILPRRDKNVQEKTVFLPCCWRWREIFHLTKSVYCRSQNGAADVPDILHAFTFFGLIEKEPHQARPAVKHSRTYTGRKEVDRLPFEPLSKLEKTEWNVKMNFASLLCWMLDNRSLKDEKCSFTCVCHDCMSLAMRQKSLLDLFTSTLSTSHTNSSSAWSEATRIFPTQVHVHLPRKSGWWLLPRMALLRGLKQLIPEAACIARVRSYVVH